jgi:hypothetical protein
MFGKKFKINLCEENSKFFYQNSNFPNLELKIFTSTPSLKTRCRGYRFGLN